ncbi:MAG: ATP-binding protein [Brevefilum sp.]|nr:ATP-binding protein [Brevefilum sp.]MDT8380762.1 ATP-binding protein [Brevefilum sp.]MDW7753651.1 ATP-binding protein [Brevefilum sp.]
MTQNIIENLANVEFSKNEGIQAILTLIDLIQDPAIIYNQTENKILTANNPLFLLTNLGENDFLGQPIEILLPDISDTDPISGHDQKAFLKHKKQPLIPVRVKIFPLTHKQNLLLLTFQPEGITTSQSRLREQVKFIENLKRFFKNQNKNNLSETLSHIVKESARILESEFISIYKASGGKPQLVQYQSNDERLASDYPKVLSGEELVNASDAVEWRSEFPPKTHLQKTAANAGYKFLITAPLGNEESKFGLLIAGSKQSNPTQVSLPLTELLAVYITELMEDQISLQNLKNLSSKIRQVVKIQNEIIENLDEGVIILAPDLTIAETNPAIETILGYANVEALRQPIDSILIGSESLGSALSSARQGIPTLTGGDLTLHHRNGTSFPAQIMMSPVMQNGHVLSIIILIKDISQQEQNQAARKQLEQRAILGEVMAIFAHEVRNPINAIMLSLQVIEDNLSEGDENLKWIDNMRDECNKLLYLMESVLSFAKPLEYKMSGVDLDFMVRHILDRWHPRLLRLNISSYYESQVGNPIVEGDLRALEQVFTNIISNSVNSMSEEGGTLGIRITEPELEEDRKFFQVILTDSGHGIPDEIKAHLFKPFVTGSDHGTGLGLAITQRIINAHKGKIEVDSYTGGTIFRIFLVKKKGMLD